MKIGARYSDYETDQFTEWLLGDGLTPPDRDQPGIALYPGTTFGGDFQEIAEDSVDGSVALNWTVDEQHFVYGLISRGHVNGGRRQNGRGTAKG